MESKIVMRLYKRTSRFGYFKRFNHATRERLKKGLRLKPGDVVNTCRGFNERVVKVRAIRWPFGRGWRIVDVDVSVEQDRRYDWLSCCEDAQPKEKIHHYLISLAESSEKWSEELQKIISMAVKGEPILNDDGTVNYELIK